MTENPYLAMDEAVLKTHADQFLEAINGKKMSKLQFFGETLSTETSNRLDQVAALSQELVDARAKIPVESASNPDVDRLAKMNLDRTISEIKTIDDNFPIKGILDSSLNSFDKIGMLEYAKNAAQYSKQSIDAIKAQVGNKQSLQGFSEPSDAGDADALVSKLIAESGVTI